MELIRRREATAWELRGHAMTGRQIVLALDDRAAMPRVRGYVLWVGPADGLVLVDDPAFPEPIGVPVEAIVSVRRPHFHEDAPLEWTRDRVRRESAPDPLPGQLVLGGEPPEVSRRSQRAVLRAAGMLLGGELMDVLAALDRAVRGRRSCSTADVAEELGRSPQWAVLRLARLAEMQLTTVSTEANRYEWAPGE